MSNDRLVYCSADNWKAWRDHIGQVVELGDGRCYQVGAFQEAPTPKATVTGQGPFGKLIRVNGPKSNGPDTDDSLTKRVRDLIDVQAVREGR